MAETKLFQLVDRNTFIPLLCICPQTSDSELIRRMAWRFGYQGSRAVIVMDMNNPSRCQNDCYNWNDRTLANAHHYVEDHWDELKTGDVIDVEFILGETKVKKTGEATFELLKP